MSLSEDRINDTSNESYPTPEIFLTYEQIMSLKQQLDDCSGSIEQREIIKNLKETILSLRPSDLKKIELLPLIINFVTPDYDIFIVLSALDIIFKYTGMENINSMILYEPKFVTDLMITIQAFSLDDQFESVLQLSLDLLQNMIINPDPVDKSEFINALIENNILELLPWALSTFCENDIENNMCCCITESTLYFLSNLLQNINENIDVSECIDKLHDVFCFILSNNNYWYIQQCMNVLTIYLNKFGIFTVERDVEILEKILFKASQFNAYEIQESFFSYLNALSNYYIDYFNEDFEKFAISNFESSNQSTQLTILELFETIRCKFGCLSNKIIGFLVSIINEGSLSVRSKALLTIMRSFYDISNELVEEIFRSDFILNLTDVLHGLNNDEKIETLSFLKKIIADNPIFIENYFDDDVIASIEEFLEDETEVALISQEILELTCSTL